MQRMPELWDYLIVTAANEHQAASYESQLELRQKIGLLQNFQKYLVVPDPEGARIGSGGSTLQCLMEVLRREGVAHPQLFEEAASAFRRLRILIIHAGGDSRRLPAYSPCGKIFIPVPGETSSALPTTLFDRLLPVLAGLHSPASEGQVVVASGDVLLRFDPSEIAAPHPGITAYGCHASPEEASRHGVFCHSGDGVVSRFLQKPSVAEQRAHGAIDHWGRAVLDTGIMSFDSETATKLLQAFCVAAAAAPSSRTEIVWSPSARRNIGEHGLDFYSEICCALGTQTSLQQYIGAVRSSGSSWPEASLREIFEALHTVPLRLHVLRQCTFLHFGSTRHLISSGLALATQDGAVGLSAVALNNERTQQGSIGDADTWIEGCRLHAPLQLTRSNVVTGVDVDEPLSLPENACLDITAGANRAGKPVWFVRCYGVNDSFKDAATFCGQSLGEWLNAVGASAADIWPHELPHADRTLWNARVFPAVDEHRDFQHWLWMYAPQAATPELRNAFLAADRYSSAEIATRASQVAYYERRSSLRTLEVEQQLRRMFSGLSGFSASDLALILQDSCNRARLVVSLLMIAREHGESGSGTGMDNLALGRIVHSLGAAVRNLSSKDQTLDEVLPALSAEVPGPLRAWLEDLGIASSGGMNAHQWASTLERLAFQGLSTAIVSNSSDRPAPPRKCLRADETIWGRAPARFDLGGGWTDTPPYTLENGGEVVNVAIDLNGQPPIHCYCRTIPEPVIRLSSIDGGKHIEITDLAELLNFRNPGDRFALGKAALALSGFSPESADWPEGASLASMLAAFGGGIELTTLVGIPQGSGLGTSSILGAVLLKVIARMMGRKPDHNELFNEVLRLEQVLTTGGGWQDQIGGCVGGAKITTTQPGLYPDPRIHHIVGDLLDPKLNGGSTLLYYTGLTRLAKNILQQVVGGYFNRDRGVMAALAGQHLIARSVSDALARKDAGALGACLNAEWKIAKRLCRAVSNQQIEELLEKVRPHTHGMKIPGAGSGGFLLLVCRSPEAAAEVRRMLELNPPNELSRFFDFSINHSGIQVTTC